MKTRGILFIFLGAASVFYFWHSRSQQSVQQKDPLAGLEKHFPASSQKVFARPEKALPKELPSSVSRDPATAKVPTPVAEVIPGGADSPVANEDIEGLIQYVDALRIPEGDLISDEIPVGQGLSGFERRQLAPGTFLERRTTEEENGTYFSERFLGPQGLEIVRSYDPSGILESIAVAHNEQESILVDFYPNGMIKRRLDSSGPKMVSRSWGENGKLTDREESRLIEFEDELIPGNEAEIISH